MNSFLRYSELFTCVWIDEGNSNIQFYSIKFINLDGNFNKMSSDKIVLERETFKNLKRRSTIINLF